MNNNKTAIFASVILLLLALIIAVPMTFAWMDVSRIPFISDMEITVITENNLLIAPDEDGVPGEFDRFLIASDYMEEYVPLKPVTYNNGEFLKVIYNDGKRTNGLEPVTEENMNVPYPGGVKSSPDSVLAEEQGYMVYLDYWIKTQGATAAVSLARPHENEEGGMTNGTYAVGRPVWSSQDLAHINGAYGAEATLRIGFEIWPADEEGNITGPSSFFIYEPNADIHTGNEESGYKETLNTDGGSLIDREHLIIQNASTWDDITPANENSVIYDVGEFTNNPILFTLDGTGMVKVRSYLWMEGQDSDCTALSLSTEEATAMIINIDFGVEESEYESIVERRDPDEL